MQMYQKHVIEGLYAITPDGLATADLLLRTKLALTGGVRVLQYRNKSADSRLRVSQASALRKLTRQFAATFIVNDDVQLAAQVEADGVHLGASDGDIKTAREYLGKQKLIGISCYNRISLARDALAGGANYLAFGAFFPSTVKPTAIKAEIELMRQARAEFSAPLVAIGGINTGNAAPLLGAGADALAVISALFDAADIPATAKVFTNLFNNNLAL